MSAPREPVVPTLDIPMDVAGEELTGFEVLAVEKHYRTDIGNLGSVRTMMGLVWCYENRREPTTWAAVEGRTLRQLAGYFAPASVEPDDDVGKEFGPDD